MKRTRDVDEIRKLAWIIDLIARKCWRGLPSLLGEAPKPTREQLKQALFFRPSPDEDLGVKVSSSGSGEDREVHLADAMMSEVDPVLDLIPWEEIVSCVRRYAAEYPRNWAMYRKYLIASEQTKVSWGNISAVSRTAEAFDCSDYVLRMTAKSVPFEIARAVSMGYGRENIFDRG